MKTLPRPWRFWLLTVLLMAGLLVAIAPTVRKSNRGIAASYRIIRQGMRFATVQALLGRPPDAEGDWPLSGPCPAGSHFYFWAEGTKPGALARSAQDPLGVVNLRCVVAELDLELEGNVLAVSLDSEGRVADKDLIHLTDQSPGKLREETVLRDIQDWLARTWERVESRLVCPLD